MDAIDILGSLLGQKNNSGGKGAQILKEIFKGATSRAGSPDSRPAPDAPRSGPTSATRTPTSRPAETDWERGARELEDLLNVAKGRSQQRPPTPATKPTAQSGPTLAPTKPASPRPAPAPAPSRQPQGMPAGQQPRSPWETTELPTTAAERQSAQALVLVRAMVNAAKSDGEISQDEQQAILQRLDNPSPETIQFLREEFARPLDVREFAWSVPVGMEQQVYSMSLIAIDVDSREESDYLQELAHGLRLGPEDCSQIEQRLRGGVMVGR